MTKAQKLGIKEFPYTEYDSNSNIIYYENFEGYWQKYDYDSYGNEIYYEGKSGYGYFVYFENNKFIKEIEEGYKEHYLAYKRNLLLNKLLND
jgi:hypothetical protein